MEEAAGVKLEQVDTRQVIEEPRDNPMVVSVQIQGGAAGPTVLSDLGREIGRGGEAIVYESRNGKSVYKAYDGNSATKIPQFAKDEAGWLNKYYYNNNFAQFLIENGKCYIKMPKLEGVPLSEFKPGKLAMKIRGLLSNV